MPIAAVWIRRRSPPGKPLLPRTVPPSRSVSSSERCCRTQARQATVPFPGRDAQGRSHREIWGRPGTRAPSCLALLNDAQQPRQRERIARSRTPRSAPFLSQAAQRDARLAGYRGTLIRVVPGRTAELWRRPASSTAPNGATYPAALTRAAVTFAAVVTLAEG
ncbi:hypothetical protein GCM10011428_55830 [Streptomyces violaceus]